MVTSIEQEKTHRKPTAEGNGITVKTLTGFLRITNDPQNPYFEKVALAILEGRLQVIEGSKRVVPKSRKKRQDWVEKMLRRRIKAKNGNLD